MDEQLNANGMARARARGVFPDMKGVSLLIFWLLPLLQIGGHDLSPSRGDAPPVQVHVTSAVIQQASDVSAPGDPSRAGSGLSLRDEDEEDSLDDILDDSGLLLPSSWRNLRRDDLLSRAQSQSDLHRPPSHPLPLRC
jgi:hypothetical protein